MVVVRVCIVVLKFVVLVSSGEMLWNRTLGSGKLGMLRTSWCRLTGGSAGKEG